MPPNVSVIIPCLNEQDSISRAIDSATQAGADEVIVVDGGSKDETQSRASSATRLEVTGPGRAQQQNHGARVSTGQILLFLHADCALPKDGLTELRQKAANPEVIAGCFQQNISDPARRYRVVESGNAWRVRLLKWAYGDQGIFVRRDIFEAVGGFPALRFMEDLYLMKRLRTLGRIILLQSALEVSARRWQRRGVARQTVRNWTLITAAHLGISPDRLAVFYPNDR